MATYRESLIESDTAAESQPIDALVLSGLGESRFRVYADERFRMNITDSMGNFQKRLGGKPVS